MELLTFLILLAVVATVVVLAMGIGTMVHGGELDFRRNTGYMIARVGIQALAVLLLLAALALQL